MKRVFNFGLLLTKLVKQAWKSAHIVVMIHLAYLCFLFEASVCIDCNSLTDPFEVNKSQ